MPPQAVTDSLVAAADTCHVEDTDASPVSSDDLLPLLIATLVKVPCRAESAPAPRLPPKTPSTPSAAW